jgi:hypothetical protein
MKIPVMIIIGKDRYILDMMEKELVEELILLMTDIQ